VELALTQLWTIINQVKQDVAALVSRVQQLEKRESNSDV
jgi:uncharacterized coiled-coil protein SlyX